MDYDFNPEERPRRRAASGLLLVLAVLVGWLSLADGPARTMSTTTVSAAIFTYDAPTVARVGVHAFGAVDVSPAQLSVTQEGSATPSVQARGPSTTASVAVVATEAAGGADNVVNGVRLRAQLTGEEIAGGHAFDKHVVQRGEFPGVTTRAGFASTIEDVVMNGEMRVLSNGRTAFWNDSVVVIRNPGALDGGTAFRPTDGYDYFLGLP